MIKNTFKFDTVWTCKIEYPNKWYGVKKTKTKSKEKNVF